MFSSSKIKHLPPRYEPTSMPVNRRSLGLSNKGCAKLRPRQKVREEEDEGIEIFTHLPSTQKKKKILSQFLCSRGIFVRLKHISPQRYAGYTGQSS